VENVGSQFHSLRGSFNAKTQSDHLRKFLETRGDAMRIMISACRLAIATYGNCTGYPDGDLIMVPYF
jgi:hypothetical protein